MQLAKVAHAGKGKAPYLLPTHVDKPPASLKSNCNIQRGDVVPALPTHSLNLPPNYPRLTGTMTWRQQLSISEKLPISQSSVLILAPTLHSESFLSCFANYDLQGNGVNSSSMNESTWMAHHDADAPLIYTPSRHTNGDEGWYCAGKCRFINGLFALECTWQVW